MGAKQPNPAPAREKNSCASGFCSKQRLAMSWDVSPLLLFPLSLSARFPTKLRSPVGAGRAAPSQQPPAAVGYFRGRGELGRSPADRLSRSAPGGSRAGSPSHTCRCLLPPAAPETDADGGLDPSDQTRAPSPRAGEGQMRSSRVRSALTGMLSQLQKPAPGPDSVSPASPLLRRSGPRERQSKVFGLGQSPRNSVIMQCITHAAGSALHRGWPRASTS